MAQQCSPTGGNTSKRAETLRSAASAWVVEVSRIVHAVVSRINTIRDAWRTQEPDRAFYGLTLAQFEAAVQPVFTVHEEAAELKKRTRANSAKRKDVEVAALNLIRNIVHAVKADPAVGEDSLLYATLGYVRRADRAGGRKRARPVVMAPPEGDTKPGEMKV